ncbi:COP9 signalosome complex subunit 5 [Perkinsus olseni]|uniref:COP9 signalosome complex subunit 5 n=1 Tax=Perkinsus olseni TaxID=32597 RepID=A0A7J6MMD6_PEROL|nr:COP9 signalosome complex subunit 5 [Perkinsus olseni]KAF4672497.1 COP9 signalosome complex subunit 5 [Perkinsus olseni]
MAGKHGRGSPLLSRICLLIGPALALGIVRPLRWTGISMAVAMAAMSLVVFLLFRRDMRFSIVTAILLANQIALVVSLRDYKMNSAWIHSMDSQASEGFQHVEYKAGDELRSASYPYVSVIVYVPRTLEGGKIPSSDISRTIDEVLENSSKSLIEEVILYAPEDLPVDGGVAGTNSYARYCSSKEVPKYMECTSEQTDTIIFVQAGVVDLQRDWLNGIAREALVRKNSIAIPVVHYGGTNRVQGAVNNNYQITALNIEKMDESPVMPQLAVFATTKFWLNEMDINQRLLRDHLSLSLSMRTWLCGGQIIVSRLSEATVASGYLVTSSQLRQPSVPFNEWLAEDIAQVNRKCPHDLNWFMSKFRDPLVAANAMAYESFMLQNSQGCLAHRNGVFRVESECKPDDKSQRFYWQDKAKMLRALGEDRCLDAASAQREGARPVSYWCMPGNDNQHFELDGQRLMWNSYCLAPTSSGDVEFQLCRDDSYGKPIVPQNWVDANKRWENVDSLGAPELFRPIDFMAACFETLCRGEDGLGQQSARELHRVYAPVDNDERERLHADKPWRSDPDFFKKARITANAVVKMVTHVASGGDIEVMGLMQGRIVGHDFLITDAFPLPVEGTETRVNAGATANEFMINFVEANESQISNDNVVGWYHSHPGYGCWLSGIDVETQRLYQRANEPFVAVVIDPVKTTAQRRVEIGAFRTYEKSSSVPSGTAADGAARVVGNIPLEKVQDFGAHANSYYSLEVEYLKSPLDNLILSKLSNSSWVSLLCSSPLSTNTDHMGSTDQQLPYLRKLVADAGAKTAASLEEITADRGRCGGGQASPKEAMVDAQVDNPTASSGPEEDFGSTEMISQAGPQQARLGERRSKKHRSSPGAVGGQPLGASRGGRGRHQRSIELHAGGPGVDPSPICPSSQQCIGLGLAAQDGLSASIELMSCVLASQRAQRMLFAAPGCHGRGTDENNVESSHQ